MLWKIRETLWERLGTGWIDSIVAYLISNEILQEEF